MGRLVFISLAATAVLVGSVGCDRDSDEPESTREEQIRETVQAFQRAVEEGDDEAACGLMTSDARYENQSFAFESSPDGPCAIENTGLQDNGIRSFPGAQIQSVAIREKGPKALVHLDDKTRVELETEDDRWLVNELRHPCILRTPVPGRGPVCSDS